MVRLLFHFAATLFFFIDGLKVKAPHFFLDSYTLCSIIMHSKFHFFLIIVFLHSMLHIVYYNGVVIEH